MLQLYGVYGLAAVVYEPLGADTQDLGCAMKKETLAAQKNLENYRLLRAACNNFRQMIAVLPPGDSRAMRLQRKLTLNLEKLASIDKALASLPEDQEKLLRVTYVDNPVPKYMLLDQLGYSQSTYYRIRREALERFSKAYFGERWEY